MRFVLTLTCASLIFAARSEVAHAQGAPQLQLQAGHTQLANGGGNSLSPTGALMASVDVRGVIKLWETQGGRLVCTLSPPNPGNQAPPVSSLAPFSGTIGGDKLAWSADGAKLISSLGSDQLALWDLHRCGQHTLLSLSGKQPLRIKGSEVAEQRDAVRFLGTLANNRVLVQTDTTLEVVQPYDPARGLVRESTFSARAQDIGQVRAHSDDGRIVVLSQDAKSDLFILDRQAKVVSALSSYPGQRDPARTDGADLGAMSPRRTFALSRSGRWLAVKSVTDTSIRIYDTSRNAMVTSVPLTGPAPPSVQQWDAWAKSSPSPQMAALLAVAKIDSGLAGLAFSSDETRVYVLREGESLAPGTGMRLEVRALLDLKLQAVHVAPVNTTAVGKAFQLLVAGHAGGEQLLVPVPGTYRTDLVSLRFKSGDMTSDVWSMEVQGPVTSLVFGRQGWLASREFKNQDFLPSGFAPDALDHSMSAQSMVDRLRMRNQLIKSQTDAWSSEQSRPTRVLAQFTAMARAAQSAFSEDGQFQAEYSFKVTGKPAQPMMSDLSLWQTQTGQMLWKREIGESGRLSGPLAISPGGRLVATIMHDVRIASAQLMLMDGRTGSSLGRLSLPGGYGSRLSFSSDGRRLFVLDDSGLTGELNVSSPDAPTLQWSKDRSAGQFPLGFLPGSGRLVMPVLPDWIAVDTSAYAIATFGGWQNVLRIPVAQSRGLAVANADESLLAVAQGDRLIRLIDISGSPKVVAEMEGMTTSVSSMAFSPDGRYLVVGDDQGGVWLWDAAVHKLRARMYTFEDGNWVVIDPEGRFDTNNLEGMKRLHWVMPDEPFRAYPLELFMRQYFQPQLLERIMSRSVMPAVPNVAMVNRAQPEVRITEVKPLVGHPEQVDVTVQVRATVDFKGRSSGAADLRLFRGGQLVAMSQLKDPHALTQLQSGREATVQFKGIRLPTDAQKVAFTAYAFNADQVKSLTASTLFDRPKPLAGAQMRRRAFVVSMGVNVHDTPDWNLSFAANDAVKTQTVLSDRLKATGLYSEVIALPLVSDGMVSHASKAQLRAVLMSLSGRVPDATVLAGIPNVDRLAAATPDDLVLITFSGHGYSDGGDFYLVPQDIGSSKQVSDAGKGRSISSTELSELLRDIDAGELSVVIDACHSAAAVQTGGFKPGPMGAKGLGQLAYDKGMRILAATQADDVALESGQLRQGLLTFALVNEGLDMGKADYQPIDKRVDVAEWLAFGEQRVPEIYQDVRAGRTIQKSGRGAWQIQARGASRAGGFKPRVQKPTLFDFRTGQPAAVMSVLE